MKRVALSLLAAIVILAMSATHSCQSGNGNSKTAKTIKVSTKKNGVETGIDIGKLAPDLVYKNPDGENLSLSSLRGQLVLVDFWASWCTSCRMEHPALVRTYMNYREKEFTKGSGFTIYGVSLDRRMNDWIVGIVDDSLVWESQVSDLKGWKSAPAAQYGVMKLPANFLLDGRGIILAKNLHGQALEDKLKELEK